MVEYSRDMVINLKLDEGNVNEVASKLQEMENESIKVKCTIDADTGKFKTNVNDLIKDIEKHPGAKLKLELDFSAAEKSMKSLKELAAKSAKEIRDVFDKNSSPRKVATLNNSVLGKKTIASDSAKAYEELIKLRETAIKRVNDLQFDMANPAEDVDIQRVYDYGRALNELSEVLKEVQSVATKRGITLPEIEGGFNIESITQQIDKLQKAAPTLIKNLATTQSTAIQNMIQNSRKTFAGLADMYSQDAFKGVAQDAKQAADQVGQATKEIKSAIESVGDQPVEVDVNVEELKNKLEEAYESIRKLRNELDVVEDERRNLLESNASWENSFLDQAGQIKALEAKLAKADERIRELDSALDNGNYWKGYYEDAQQSLDLVEGELEEAKLKIEEYKKSAQQAGTASGTGFADMSQGAKQASDQVEQVTTEIKNMVNSVDDKPIEIDINTERLNNEADNAFETIRRLRNEIETLKNEKESLNSLNFEQGGKISELENEIERLDQRLRELDDLADGKESPWKYKYEDLKAMLEMVQSELEVAKAEIKDYETAVQQAGTASGSGFSDEVDDTVNLEYAIKNLTDAVDAKTKAFQNEGAVVASVVDDEVTYLEVLKSTLNDIVASVKNGSKAFKTFDLFGGSSNSKSVSTALDKQSKTFVAQQLKSLDAVRAKFSGSGITDFGELDTLRELLVSDFSMTGLSQMGNEDAIHANMVAYSEMFTSIINGYERQAAAAKATAEAEKAASKEAQESKANVEAHLKEYQRDYEAEAKLLRAQMKNGSLTETQKFDLNAVQQRIKANEELLRGETEFQAMQERRVATQKDLVAEYNAGIDQSVKKSKELLETYSSDKFADPAKYKELEESVTRLQSMTKDGIDIISEEDTAEVLRLRKQVDELYATLNKSGGMRTNRQGTFVGTLTGLTGTKDDKAAIENAIRGYKELQDAQVEFSNWTSDYSKMTLTVKTNDGMLVTYKGTVDKATGAVRILQTAESEYISQGKAFVNSIKGKFAELTRYITVLDVVQKMFTFLKQGVQAVVDINTAMTELRKVTDETEASYAKFGQTAGEIASQVGSTRKEITNSTADFARLGFSLPDATELAKNAAIYKNVGDGIDITTATEDIISTMKAFDIAASDSMGIIDELNELGNSYAVSSGGLGEILQKSSSALAAGNNTLEETLAMGTAMNEVLQNTSTTGTTLKMLSLRIRGASNEIIEMGESTDGMAESTSKLQKQIAALTNVTGKGGFNILEDDGKTFKSTYDIMKGISEVWDDMSDVSQAGLLELIAGCWLARICRNTYIEYI